MTPPLHLSGEERLSLQQLRLAEWAERRSEADDASSRDGRGKPSVDSLPSQWLLTRGIELAPWQKEAREAWFAAGHRGTIKVVTGAGKTVVALAIAERLQANDPSLYVAIVAPTIVLMNQWLETFRTRSNLPESAVGRLGGGYADHFDRSCRVLIAVLASARKDLPIIVQRAGVGDHLLFIADECHRAGAPEMSAVLQTRRRYSLGLSATPERHDDIDAGPAAGYEDSRLAAEIGPIIYEMTFAEALRLGVLPPFEVYHFGLPLSSDETRRYEALSRSISETRRELMAASPAARKYGGGDQLVAWARRVSARGASDLATLAARFMHDTTRRKQLIYRAESRVAATHELIRDALDSRSDARVILFHESIDEVVALFDLLRRDGIPAVMDHSDLPTDLREASIELFREGTAKVIVSARSLIEGFNVPAADLGIIVASSSSPRQRIQSIGRVLRTYRDRAGVQKSSRVCVLYVRDTVDERIYEREDWGRLVGLDRNHYFRWDPPDDPLELPGPPRMAVPREDEIDVDCLESGGAYPGWYDGAEFSTDSQGNVLDPDGRVATNPQRVPALVMQLKGQPGRFRVTPKHGAILVRVPSDDEGWTTLYGGRLVESFQFSMESPPPADLDVSRLVPGDPYPGPTEPADEYRFRQRAGGVIAKRVRGGEVFARGPNASQIVAALRGIARAERPISKIYVNRLGHVFWHDEGKPRLIAVLNGELEFPSEA